MKRTLVLGTLAALAGLVMLVPETDAQQPWPTPARCPLDAGLVIDVSNSMISNGANAPTQAGSVNFVNQLGPNDQSALASFGVTGYRNKELDFDHDATRAAIMALAFADGSTAMGEGILRSRDQFLDNGRPDGRWVMVVLTDGQTNTGTAPLAAGNAARAVGIEVYVIGVGANVNHGQNQQAASDPDSKYYRPAPTVADIEAAYQEILEDAMDCRPIPDFDWVHDCAGQPYTFTDLSVPLLTSATIANSTWDWGDGSPPQLVDPWQTTVTHTYATPGTYLVNLTVFDSYGRFNSIEKEIEVDMCPNVLFDCVSLTEPYLRIRYTDLTFDSDNDLVRWRWTFDGGTPTSGSPPAGEPNEVREGPGPWEVDYPAMGTYSVTLEVWDSHGHFGNATMDCTAVLNRPPVIDPHPVYVVYAGNWVEFTVTGYDPDGDDVTWGWQRGPLPFASTYDTVQQKFRWFPGGGDVGTWQGVLFTISDGEYTSSTTVTIVVLRPPDAPPPDNADADDDGIPDQQDNCPWQHNPAQGPCGETDTSAPPCADCPEAPPESPPESPPVPERPDADNDGVPDALDNCPAVPNQDQADLDRDDEGDACDDDIDGDGVTQFLAGAWHDVCPFTHDPEQVDSDGDGIGDACAGDADGDGIADAEDDCPYGACDGPRPVAGGAGENTIDATPARSGFPWLPVGLGAVAAAAGAAGIVALLRRRPEDS